MKLAIRLALVSVCMILFSFPAQAAPKTCGEVPGMNVTDPALTHTFLPIKGGTFQGIHGYDDVSKWVYHSKQGHMACEGCNGMPYDASKGILNPASTHMHTEYCWPDYAVIQDPITFPIRARAYDLDGYFAENGGPLIENVTWDVPQDVPWHLFKGLAMGVVAESGHATYNPRASGDGGPPIHSAVPNGWSIMEFTIEAYLNNGNVIGMTGQSPIFTLTDPTAFENPAFTPSSSAGTGITSVLDGGSAPWGSQIIECRVCIFPYLGDFNTPWPLDNVFGYMYGGTIGFSGETTVCDDMDLHNGILGNCLPGMPANNNGPGYLAVTTPGQHTRTMIWHTSTGPTGIVSAPDADGVVSFIGHPNEDVWALDGFNIEIGPPPPQTECRDLRMHNFGEPLPCEPWDDTHPPPPPPPGPPVDCVVGAWADLGTSTTTSLAVTAGAVQTRVITSGLTQQRPILTLPVNGGAACSLQ